MDTFAGTVDRDNTNLLTREFAGKTYMIEYTVDGFFNDTELCYTSGDCSGQTYFCDENPTTPPLAVYDGTVLGGNSGQNFNVPIFSAKVRGVRGLGTGPCPQCPSAIVLDGSVNQHFVPPFSAKCLPQKSPSSTTDRKDRFQSHTGRSA